MRHRRVKDRRVFRPRTPWSFPLSREEKEWCLATKRRFEERYFWGYRPPVRSHVIIAVTGLIG